MFLTSKILAICLVILLFFSFSFYVGYSYRDYLVVQAERQEQEAIAKKQQSVTKERQDTNDVLNNHKQEQAKAKQEIQNTNQIVTQEVIKYVKDSNAANDAIDDEFVRVYNQSLPN